MPQCTIQWINHKGELTPDTNEAIGVVYREAYSHTYRTCVVHFEQTEEFPICAEHVKQLSNCGMELWHFEPYRESEKEL